MYEFFFWAMFVRVAAAQVATSRFERAKVNAMVKEMRKCMTEPKLLQKFHTFF